MEAARDLNQIVESLERLSLDDNLYFRLRNSSDLGVCISYHRKGSPSPWCLWYEQNENASRRQISRLHIGEALRTFSVTERQLTDELANVLLTQVGYADEFIHEVERVLGQEAVCTAISQTQDFLESLRVMVSEVLQNNGSQAGKEENGEQSETGPVRLQIVKSE